MRFWTYFKGASNRLEVRRKKTIEVKDDFKSSEWGSRMYRGAICWVREDYGKHRFGEKATEELFWK